MGYRIHVLGASGTGTSTLARGLATALSSQAFDTDDFYWLPTDPPFVEKRRIAERLELMEAVFLPRADWVLSGSFGGWGEGIVPRITHVVFLTMLRGARLARLRARERRRYGDAIDGGGQRESAYRSFLDWAAGYDDATFTGRSRHFHEDWLSRLACPVIRLDAGLPVQELVASVTDRLDPPAAGT